MIIDVENNIFSGTIGFERINRESFFEIFIQGDGSIQKLFWEETDVVQMYVDSPNWRIEEWESTLS